jgi:hypothetical protein
MIACRMPHQSSEEVPKRDEIDKHNRLTSYVPGENLSIET